MALRLGCTDLSSQRAATCLTVLPEGIFVLFFTLGLPGPGLCYDKTAFTRVQYAYCSEFCLY